MRKEHMNTIKLLGMALLLCGVINRSWGMDGSIFWGDLPEKKSALLELERELEGYEQLQLFRNPINKSLKLFIYAWNNGDGIQQSLPGEMIEEIKKYLNLSPIEYAKITLLSLESPAQKKKFDQLESNVTYKKQIAFQKISHRNADGPKERESFEEWVRLSLHAPSRTRSETFFFNIANKIKIIGLTRLKQGKTFSFNEILRAIFSSLERVYWKKIVFNPALLDGTTLWDGQDDLSSSIVYDAADNSPSDDALTWESLHEIASQFHVAPGLFKRVLNEQPDEKKLKDIKDIIEPVLKIVKPNDADFLLKNAFTFTDQQAQHLRNALRTLEQTSGKRKRNDRQEEKSSKKLKKS